MDRPNSREIRPCTPVDEPYVGTLCAPDSSGSGRHGAIVFFGGYGGDIEAKRLALEFAQRGYVTAAVSYFGAPRTPRVLVDVPVEIGVAAVAALAARRDVDPARLAVMGSAETFGRASRGDRLHPIRGGLTTAYIRELPETD